MTAAASGCGGSSVHTSAAGAAGQSGAATAGTGATSGSGGTTTAGPLQPGCTAPAVKLTREEATEQVKEYAFADSPTLSPNTYFDVTDMPIEGLWEAQGVQIFYVIYSGSQGSTPFREEVFTGFQGKVTYFLSLYGGPGFNSALMHDGELFFSYSFGSGVFRSQVGLMRIEACELKYLWSPGYPLHVAGVGPLELFLIRGANGPEVESGMQTAFNTWDNGEWFGRIVVTPEQLQIVDAAGVPVPKND